MDASSLLADVNPEVGRYLSTVRERAGIKQAHLAKKMRWSPTLLSRIESGERVIGEEELKIILDAIGTPEAAKLHKKLTRQWQVIPRPPLDHPDDDALWDCELAAQDLLKLRNQPDIPGAFERRISAYLEEIGRAAGHLIKREHIIAVIGSIGIGKSTAICRMLGLEVTPKDATAPVPVLEAGAGGITICEVHLHAGPNYGVLVEPAGDEELRAHVSDFVDHVLGTAGAVDAENEEEESKQGISKELERAIRNMSDLRIRRERNEHGKLTRFDKAKDLAKRVTTSRELVVEVLARMQLHQRDRRAIWYDASSGKLPLVWLKDVFEEVNNGRHPEVMLPKRIEVLVPMRVLEESECTVRFVDTKGIDKTAARPDLENLLDDPHTISVLCSAFNNAPQAEAQLLLQRAKDVGVRELDLRAAILVLPRANEALAVKDESGIRVESAVEGYELKEEQIALALAPLGRKDIAIGFYDAFTDEPGRLRAFLLERIAAMRGAFRRDVEDLAGNARTLLRNHAEVQVQEVQRAVSKLLAAWLAKHKQPPVPAGHVHDSLMAEMGRVYASSLRASVRRDGEWINLSYSHHLGYGARRVAALALAKTVEGFLEICETLAASKDHAAALELIKQAQHLIGGAYEDLLRKVQLMGQTSFREPLKLDAAFWARCNAEWGQGGGYRDRVMAHNTVWFSDAARRQLERELHSLIEREWSEVIGRLEGILVP